jgi:hypothetical protein
MIGNIPTSQNIKLHLKDDTFSDVFKFMTSIKESYCFERNGYLIEVIMLRAHPTQDDIVFIHEMVKQSLTIEIKTDIDVIKHIYEEVEPIEIIIGECAAMSNIDQKIVFFSPKVSVSYK